MQVLDSGKPAGTLHECKNCRYYPGMFNLQVGDRVCVLSTSGCWAEFIAVPVGSVFPIPDDMSFEDAAALPVNYLTAYFILYDFGNLRKGKSVLVHMAAGMMYFI